MPDGLGTHRAALTLIEDPVGTQGSEVPAAFAIFNESTSEKLVRIRDMRWDTAAGTARFSTYDDSYANFQLGGNYTASASQQYFNLVDVTLVSEIIGGIEIPLKPMDTTSPAPTGVLVTKFGASFANTNTDRLRTLPDYGGMYPVSGISKVNWSVGSQKFRGRFLNIYEKRQDLVTQPITLDVGQCLAVRGYLWGAGPGLPVRVCVSGMVNVDGITYRFCSVSATHAGTTVAINNVSSGDTVEVMELAVQAALSDWAHVSYISAPTTTGVRGGLHAYLDWERVSEVRHGVDFEAVSMDSSDPLPAGIVVRQYPLATPTLFTGPNRPRSVTGYADPRMRVGDFPWPYNNAITTAGSMFTKRSIGSRFPRGKSVNGFEPGFVIPPGEGLALIHRMVIGTNYYVVDVTFTVEDLPATEAGAGPVARAYA